jgi:hypothetical protein
VGSRELIDEDSSTISDSRRETSETSHVHSITAISSSINDLVEKDHIGLLFLDGHLFTRESGQGLSQESEFVKVSGKECSALDVVVEVLEDSPSEGETIEGRSATTDLIHHNERTRSRVVEDIGGLDHFHHEGGSVILEVIRCSYSTKHPVDDPHSGI